MEKENGCILIIDDEAPVRFSLKAYLEDCSYTVFDAADGKAGLELFNTEKPDVVLCDLRMPVMSGFEVLKTITAVSPDTAVIAVSGTDDISEVVKAISLGSFDYILKPVQDFSVLNHSIRKALERKKLKEENLNYQQHLEDEIEKRTAELAELNANLKEIVKKRTRKLRKALYRLKKTQKNLIISEKMAALFNLSAGFAHEINTPLGIAVTTASWIKDELDKLEEDEKAAGAASVRLKAFKKPLESMQKNLEEANQLVSGMKTLTAGSYSGSRKIFSMHRVLENAVQYYRKKAEAENITITFSCPETFQPESYPDVFYRIFLNLIDNSFAHAFSDALPGTVDIKITVNTKNFMICYTDSGKGICKEDTERIFEPFYTTARQSGHKGLGLNQIYNLVKLLLKGEIKLYGQDTNGFRLELLLPL
jgi:YesN/AraC family two-component response regulator